MKYTKTDPVQQHLQKSKGVKISFMIHWVRRTFEQHDIGVIAGYNIH